MNTILTTTKGKEEKRGKKRNTLGIALPSILSPPFSLFHFSTTTKSQFEQEHSCQIPAVGPYSFVFNATAVPKRC